MKSPSQEREFVVLNKIQMKNKALVNSFISAGYVVIEDKFVPQGKKQSKPVQECRCFACKEMERLGYTDEKKFWDDWFANKEKKQLQQDKYKHGTRTYEETLETVKKLSKLMQKEGWEEIEKQAIGYMGKKYGQYNYDFMEAVFFFKEIMPKLLATERQKVEEMIKKAKLEAYDEFFLEIDREFESFKIDEAMGKILSKLRSEQRAKLQRIIK